MWHGRESTTNYRSNNEAVLMISLSGMPIGDKIHSLTVGSRGSIVLHDVCWLDELRQFNRENIPECCGYSKGTSALVILNAQLIMEQVFSHASFLDKPNKRMTVAVQFSRFLSQSGSCDTMRDIRGISIIFYTERGNFDLICNRLPAFFIRDPLLYPSLVYS